MTLATTEAHGDLRSFAAQTLHYFDRAHSGVRREPLSVPAAWRGEDLTDGGSWIERIPAHVIDALESANAASAARPMAALTRADFAAAALQQPIARWRQVLSQGRGFVLLRGLPVERWGDEVTSRIYWGLGLLLGTPGPQNPDGDLLGHVIDTGEEASNPHVRRYRTAGDIAYHCDLADVVGLLCLRTPISGGASRIASSVAVYNELLARRPDLVERLYEPFLLDTRGEQGDGRPPYIPVPPCRFDGEQLRTFYHSDYFRSVVRHADVPVFTDRERELLDLYEEIANSPALRFDMHFERGDIQLLSNHVVLHARTAYDDHPERERKRHLLRLWLSLERS